MKKIILALMAGILLIGTNLYAAGNLYVEGKVGVGIDPIDYPLSVAATDKAKAIKASLDIIDVSVSALTNIAGDFTITSSQMSIPYGRFIGFNGSAVLKGDGTVTALGGSENVIVLSSSTGSATIGQAFGNMVSLRRSTDNTKNHTITDYYGFYSFGNAGGGSGIFSGTDWRHAYFEDFPDFVGTITNVAGLWIDQQTRGTKNYGIVLNGDGFGADIVFGPNQEASIYSDAGELYVQDGAGFETQISPHDPKTGEWIFYSKNVKTGRVLRVNMEELVRDMEKLTGKKYLIETFIESK